MQKSDTGRPLESRGILKSWIHHHPIAAYILLALAWSWSFWSFLFLIIEPGGLLHDPPPLAFLFVVLGGIGPSLSGLVVTGLLDGREGLQALWGRLRLWRVGRWWLALLIIPGITAVTPFLRWIAGHPVDLRAMVSLVVPGLGLGVTAGLMEEIGWRGFLLPRLLKRHSPFVSTVLLSLVWGGLWHGYADYFGLGDKGIAFWPLVLMLGPILLMAWSLVLTWVYEGTRGSLLLSVLMHASLSSSALILGQKYATPREEITWTAISVGVALLASSLIWLGARAAREPRSHLKNPPAAGAGRSPA